MKSAIIISASSDIGSAIAEDWLTKNIQIFGTYRTYSPSVQALQKKGAQFLPCDLSKVASVKETISQLTNLGGKWDYLIMCPATQEPFGAFAEIDFDSWEESININFTNQLRLLQGLLPFRQSENKKLPLVLFFAGGGPNKAPVNYSAYSVSKVALIKMCELLAAEITDTRFVIVNPGWVKTKSQNTMVDKGAKIGDDYHRTIEKFKTNDWTPMTNVIGCCNWIMDTPHELISGRYFGVEFDSWGTEEFNRRLSQDSNFCKLRRKEPN